MIYMVKIESKLDKYLLAFLSLFLIISFIIVEDFGINIDSLKNFKEGENHLNYLLTGINSEQYKGFFRHGSFFFLIAEVSKRIFADNLHFLSEDASRFIILPVSTVIFSWFLYLFVKEYWNEKIAFSAILILITFPCFFGHVFGDLKDIPLVIFFTLTIMYFVKWLDLKKPKYLFLSTVFFSFGFCSKIYILVAPLIIFMWMLCAKVVPPENIFKKDRLLLMALIFIVIVGVFYAPAMYSKENLDLIFSEKDRAIYFFIGREMLEPSNGWTPLLNLILKSPLVVLLLFIFGLNKLKVDKLNKLLIAWFLIPILLACIIPFAYSNGLRLFLVYIVPFSIIASIGIWNISKSIKSGFFILAVALICNIYILFSMHPYQVAYYNFLAGGIKGAKKINIPDAGDYWLKSQKEIGLWLNKNAAKNANIYFYLECSIPYFSYYGFPLKYYIKRKDLNVQDIKYFENNNALSNVYIVLFPTIKDEAEKNIVQKLNCKKAFQIKRMNSTISTVYYIP